MKKPSKRHHVVPQFLLDRFAKDGLIELIDRHNFTKRRQSAVPTALAQNDFYTLESDAGRDPAVEKMFADEVEGPAASALRKVIDQRRSSTFPALRQNISAFLAFQFIRGESTRRAIVEEHRAMFQKTALVATPEILRADIRRRESREPSEQEVRELWEFAQNTDAYKVVVPNEAEAHLGIALPIAQELIPLIYDRQWVILVFDTPLLLTGDEPVAVVGKKLKPGEAGGGIKLGDEVVFAADPRHALVLTQSDEPDEARRGTPRMASIINRHVAFGCHRFIAQTPGLDTLKGMALPKKAAPTQTFGNFVLFNPRLSVAGAADVKRRVLAMDRVRRGKLRA